MSTEFLLIVFLWLAPPPDPAGVARQFLDPGAWSESGTLRALDTPNWRTTFTPIYSLGGDWAIAEWGAECRAVGPSFYRSSYRFRLVAQVNDPICGSAVVWHNQMSQSERARYERERRHIADLEARGLCVGFQLTIFPAREEPR